MGFSIFSSNIVLHLVFQALTIFYFKYLKDLECPYQLNQSNAIIIEWLLGFAIRLEYNENLAKYQTPVVSNFAPMSIAGPSKGSDNPLEKLNCKFRVASTRYFCYRRYIVASVKEADFKEGVTKLANLLGVAQHPDHLIVLKVM